MSKHSVSQVHLECMEKWRYSKNTEETGSVEMNISEIHKSTIERNRDYLARVCDIVKLLSKFGWPFHGHDERKEAKMKGNFLEVWWNFQENEDSC